MIKMISKVKCIEICEAACMLQVFLLALEQAVEVLTVALQEEKKKRTKGQKIRLIYKWYFLIQ